MVKMAEEPLTIAVSDKFWVRARSGYDQAAETFAFKTGDAVAHLLNATTHDTLAILDHTGRIYNVDASELPNTRGGEGMPLSAQFEAQGKFLHPFVVKANQSYMMYSDLGHGFIAKSTDFMTRMKAGKVMLVPAEGGIPMSPCLLRPEDKRVFCLSSDGSLVGFALSELPELSKGKGVALMGLREGCKVISMIVLNETEQLQIIEKGKAKTLKEEEVAACFGPRSAGKKGKKVAQTAEAKLGKV
jgi:topoisomerase-4 subunit A